MNKRKHNDDLYEEIDYLNNELNLIESIANEQRCDIKRFLLLLIKEDIPIPEDLINRYINKKPTSNNIIELPF